MSMDAILNGLIGSGPIGAVLAYMLWQNNKLQERLFTVIEKNTQTQVEIKEALQINTSVTLETKHAINDLATKIPLLGS